MKRIQTTKLSLLFLVIAMIFLSCDEKETTLNNSTNDNVIETDGKVEAVNTDHIHINPNDDEKPAQTLPLNRYKWSYIISTGQTACYNNIEEIDCPKIGEAFFGQDGSYKVGVRSYDTSSGDGTVFDNVTHLRWQRGVATDMTWFQAKTYCQELHVADKNWRLPTTIELKTLVDYGTSSPAIDSAAFPDTPSDWFWATEARNAANASWVIYFLDGFVEYTAQTNKYSVRCVER